MLAAQRKCLASKCLQDVSSFEAVDKCVRNCETGQRELLTMQKKHAEVTRLTYSKNVQKCEQIHGAPSAEAYESGQLDAVGLAHCLLHNTDKVDRRFFGYYGSQRQSLAAKYV